MREVTSAAASRTRSWLVIAVTCAVACAPEEEPRREIPPITWSGEHLDYAPQQGAYALCDGTLPYMDRYVGLAAGVMGVELDGPLVYVQGGSNEAEGFCEHEATLGCAFRDSVYSRVAPQEHELVHGVRGAFGFSHLFFEEGTAEVFGDDTKLSLRVPANGDLGEAIESAKADGGLPTRWYPRAGHFVAHLHERYGAEVTEAVLRETDAYSSAERAIAVVEQATGRAFAKLRAEYEGEESCDQRHYRYPLYACDEPAALRERCDGEVAVAIRERVACDDATTLGPRDGEIWKYVAFDVPADGEYMVFSYSDESAAGSRISIKECSMRCESIVIEKATGIELELQPVFLRAGRYEVRISRPVEAPGVVEVRVWGADCW